MAHSITDLFKIASIFKNAPAQVPQTPIQASPAPVAPPVTAVPAVVNPPMSAADLYGPEYSDAAKAAMEAKVSRSKKLGAIPEALAGIGDAITAGYGRAPTNFLNTAVNTVNKGAEDTRSRFESGRKEKVGEYGISHDLLTNARQDQVNAQEANPDSSISEVYRKLAKKMMPTGNFDKQSAAQIKTAVPALEKMYEIEQKKLDRAAAATEKHTQASDKEWTSFITKHDPATGSSRTVIGRIGNTNINVDRALSTLNKPTLTNADAGNVMADIASIYQNGSPTEFGMKHQQYETAYGKAKELLQYVSGNPTGVVPDKIRSHMKDVLMELKKVNHAALQSAFTSAESGNRKLVGEHAQEWQDFKSSFLPLEEQGPKPGDVEEGHRFKGGNPADPANWEKI